MVGPPGAGPLGADRLQSVPARRLRATRRRDAGRAATRNRRSQAAMLREALRRPGLAPGPPLRRVAPTSGETPARDGRRFHSIARGMRARDDGDASDHRRAMSFESLGTL